MVPTSRQRSGVIAAAWRHHPLVGVEELLGDLLDRPVLADRRLVVVERAWIRAHQVGGRRRVDERREDVREPDLEGAEVPEQVLRRPDAERDPVPVLGPVAADRREDGLLPVRQDVDRVHRLTSPPVWRRSPAAPSYVGPGSDGTAPSIDSIRADAPASSTGPLRTSWITPFGVDEELGRQREHPVGPQDVAGAIEADRVVELVAVGVRADVGRRRLLDADADDREPPVAVLRVERAQDRRLLLARRAPRRPEVEPHDLAAEGVEPDRPAVEVGQLVGGAVDEGRRELGRRLARPQALGRRLADDERGGLGVDEVRADRGVAERGRDRDADDRHDRDRHGAEQQLAAAERADQAVALALVAEPGSLLGHGPLRWP